MRSHDRDCWLVPRGLLLPATALISQPIRSHPLGRLGGCTALPSARGADHPQFHTMGRYKRKPCVSRDNYCLLSSLRGFSAGFSSIYFDFSTKLNQICSEAYENSDLSPLPPLHPYTHKSIHFHSFFSGGMRNQSAFFP